jgi:hypothetical protein
MDVDKLDVSTPVRMDAAVKTIRVTLKMREETKFVLA